MISRQHVTTLATQISLTDRTALVIGATAGIGRAVAEQLARAGATTILAGRDPSKLAAVAAQLEAIAPGRIRVQQVDLADLASIRRAAAALSAAYPVLDIVIANAAIMALGKARAFTRDGFEMTMGVNHLGNSALLLGLEGPIRAASAARIVVVASDAHRRAGGLPLDDLMGDRSFGGMRAYARSKLANILFARELAERWSGTRIFTAHPGVVLTDMIVTTTGHNLLLRIIFRMIRSKLLAPADAAAGLVRIAADPMLSAPTGTYFELGRPDTPSRLADDRELGRRLFERTLGLIGLAPTAVLSRSDDRPATSRFSHKQVAMATTATVAAVGTIGAALASRQAGVSLPAWLILKIIPAASRQFKEADGIEQVIRDNRTRGPALPSRRSRRTFVFADQRWDDIRVLRLAAPRSPATPLKLLYLHGGAYVLHLQPGQWSLPIALLKRLGGEVVAPLYPLAPEHDFRAGQDAVRRAYQRLADECGAKNIVVIADSAGGGLALALAQSLRDGGLPLPAALVLFSPWLDVSVTGADQPAIEPTDPALSIAFLRAAGKLWARDVPAGDPRVSPLFGDLDGLPPVLVFSGTRDILDSDALRFAEKAPAATLKHYSGLFHVWPSAPIPEGRKALDEAAAFIRQITSKSA